MSDLALETQSLVRRFGELVAVDGIDLRVPSGSFYGFLGPNGAGKSTTIRCLTGLLRPSQGTLRILGMDPARERLEIQRRIGVLPEDLALFQRLKGRETLQFIGQVHGLEPLTIERRREELLDLMDLSKAGNDLVADYSHGMRKKLALAAALLPAPRLLFLDEPFEGIDAIASRQIKTLLETFVQGGGTVFLTSHILEIVESLCDHIGVIHRGKMVAQGSLDQLQAGRDGRSLEEIFLQLVGVDGKSTSGRLDWLNR